ncbi:hypothetical protein [Thalassobacillus devorans]|nr:hypothetical protein [Thalassobacillus devorans]
MDRPLNFQNISRDRMDFDEAKQPRASTFLKPKGIHLQSREGQLSLSLTD